MFEFLRKRSEVDKLYDKYNRLLSQAHSLAMSSRSASDEKYKEADLVMQRIIEIEKGKKAS